MSARQGDCSLKAEGGMGDKVASPDITAGLPCVLQIALGEMLSVFKEALVELILGWHLLLTWVFVTRIADVFILGLNALHADDSFTDVGHHVLQLEDEEVPLILSPVWRAAQKCIAGVCSARTLVQP
jgi:hypothetical protein